MEDRLQVELLRVAVEDPLHPPGQVPSSPRGKGRVEHVHLVIIWPVPPDVEPRRFRRLRGRVDGPRAAARLERDPVALDQVGRRLVSQSQRHHPRVVQGDGDAVAGRDDREPAALRVVEVDVDEARYPQRSCTRRCCFCHSCDPHRQNDHGDRQGDATRLVTPHWPSSPTRVLHTIPHAVRAASRRTRGLAGLSALADGLERVGSRTKRWHRKSCQPAPSNSRH
jgi:hypothetical protein